MITTAQFIDLVTLYSRAENQLVFTIDELLEALVNVVEIDTPNVKSELMNSFHQVYQEMQEGLFTPLLGAVKALNRHVTKESGLDSINKYLEKNSLTVPRGYAKLSRLVGESIDTVHIN